MVETWEVKEKLQFVNVYAIQGLDNDNDSGGFMQEFQFNGIPDDSTHFAPPILILF